MCKPDQKYLRHFRRITRLTPLFFYIAQADEVQVARKTFVDNVCIQVIERHILRELPSLFSPETVAAYTEHELQRIAGEDEARIAKRKQLQGLHENLNSALRDLRK